MLRIEERRSKSSVGDVMRGSWLFSLKGRAHSGEAFDRTQPPSAQRSMAKHPARHRVELFDELRIARLGRRDQRGVERAVRSDRARLVFAREIAGEPRHQEL